MSRSFTPTPPRSRAKPRHPAPHSPHQDPPHPAPQPPHENPHRPGKPSAAAIGFLMLWHGGLSGGFIVAMLTGDGAYNAHTFAGLVVIFAIALRVLVGTMFPQWHVLSFPLPSLKSLGMGTNGVRRFLSHVMGLTLLVFCALASLTGWYARPGADAHSAISYLALSLSIAHVGLVLFMQGWKKVEAFARNRS